MPPTSLGRKPAYAADRDVAKNARMNLAAQWMQKREPAEVGFGSWSQETVTLQSFLVDIGYETMTSGSNCSIVALLRKRLQTPSRWHEPLRAGFDPEAWTPHPDVTDLQTASTFDGELSSIHDSQAHGAAATWPIRTYGRSKC